MNPHSFDHQFWKKALEEDKHLIKEWGPVFVIVLFSLALIDSLGKHALPIILLGLGSYFIVYAWKQSLEIQNKYLEEQRRELRQKLNELQREIRSSQTKK